MPRGASATREREYEELKQRFERSGRYGNGATEVAARIVNKQRAQYGETKAEKEKDRKGKSPDSGLPLGNYQHLTIPQIASGLRGFSKGDLRNLEKYENSHKNRKGALAAIDKQLKS